MRAVREPARRPALGGGAQRGRQQPAGPGGEAAASAGVRAGPGARRDPCRPGSEPEGQAAVVRPQLGLPRRPQVRRRRLLALAARRHLLPPGGRPGSGLRRHEGRAGHGQGDRPRRPHHRQDPHDAPWRLDRRQGEGRRQARARRPRRRGQHRPSSRSRPPPTSSGNFALGGLPPGNYSVFTYDRKGDVVDKSLYLPKLKGSAYHPVSINLRKRAGGLLVDLYAGTRRRSRARRSSPR